VTSDTFLRAMQRRQLLLLLVGAVAAAALDMDGSEDIPSQRQALIAIRDFLGGDAGSWRLDAAKAPSDTPFNAWDESSNASYCTWLGVACCASSPLSRSKTVRGCSAGPRSVVALAMDSFGLRGTMPEDLGQLVDLAVLSLGQNPDLIGRLPEALESLPVLWLSAVDTGLTACAEPEAYLPATSCQLPGAFLFSPQQEPALFGEPLLCPRVMLSSFARHVAGLPASLASKVTMPFPPTDPPGAVIAGPGFARFFNCTCMNPGDVLSASGGVALCAPQMAPSLPGQPSRQQWIIIAVLVSVLPCFFMFVGAVLFVRYKATIHKLVRAKQQQMEIKRRRVPAAPEVALQDGLGMLPAENVLVTWVFTDVAGSTKLWEDYHKVG
jgi:hypothetical protein